MHGLGVQSAEGLAEWLHSDVRRQLEIEPDQGRRYSWGYPACPDQSEHEKVWRLLGLEEIGMTLSDGYAVMPEQSTVAIVAHHPQAVYFGMKSGFIPEDKAPDELIAGTERGGELPPESDPDDGDARPNRPADRVASGFGTVEARQPPEPRRLRHDALARCRARALAARCLASSCTGAAESACTRRSLQVRPSRTRAGSPRATAVAISTACRITP